MDLYARDKKLRAALGGGDECRRRFGAETAKKLRLRVAALLAAESLADFWPASSPPERCQELQGSRTGVFSMVIKHPYSLLFRPVSDNEPDDHCEEHSDERRRWEGITEIELLAIEDTHA